MKHPATIKNTERFKVFTAVLLKTQARTTCHVTQRHIPKNLIQHKTIYEVYFKPILKCTLPVPPHPPKKKAIGMKTRDTIKNKTFWKRNWNSE